MSRNAERRAVSLQLSETRQ